MNKIGGKNIIALIVVIIFIIVFSFHTNGYRTSPLGAAKAHIPERDNLVLLEEVDCSWSKVYVFDTENGSRTAISVKSGFLWNSPVVVRIDKSDDPVKTVGWMSYYGKENEVTVLAVETTDPQIAYIEAGPTENRIKKEVVKDKLTVLTWDKVIEANNELQAVALAKDGSPLYEYRFPKNTTVFKNEDLKWYSVNGEK